VYGDVQGGENVLVRMHSKCLTGDVFHSRRCDCGWQLHTAMEMIAHEGVVRSCISIRKGAGLGCSTSSKRINSRTPVRIRSKPTKHLALVRLAQLWYLARKFCFDLGLHSIRVLTNNPKKIVDSKAMACTSPIAFAIVPPETSDNAEYLRTKQTKLGHLLAFVTARRHILFFSVATAWLSL